MATIRTADGVEIVHGLRVWNNDLDAGTIDLEYRAPEPELNQNNGHVEHWFYMVRDKDGQDGHRHITSESRVAVTHPFTGKRA